MNNLLLFLTIFILQASPHTKLIYEFTGNFSGGSNISVNLWQYYDEEGQMELGGYEHKMVSSDATDSFLTTESTNLDLDDEEVQKILQDAGIPIDKVQSIKTSPAIDSRTSFMCEYAKSPELFMTTADSVFDIRIGMNEKEVLGFPKSMLQWNLHDETRNISGYQSQKATINYFGRTFTAWFTPEIPLDAGPYLFSGLPGTIVELNDDHGVYNYTLLEVVRSRPPDGVAFPETEITLNHKQAFQKQWKAVQQLLSDQRGSEERMQRILSQRTGTTSSSLQLNSKPIEFNPYEHFFEWTILDEFLDE